MGNELDVNEWIGTAQEDFDVASLLAQVPCPVPVCYHCQQAVEKILKAYIIAKENGLTKTHDLVPLIKKCEKHSIDFDKFESACFELTQYATATRYPPITRLTEQMMKQALKHTVDILDFAMSKLKDLGYDKSTRPTSDSMKKIIDAINSLQRQKNPE